jgi:hypothetical protein
MGQLSRLQRMRATGKTAIIADSRDFLPFDAAGELLNPYPNAGLLTAMSVLDGTPRVNRFDLTPGYRSAGSAESARSDPSQGCFVFQAAQSSATFFIGLTANRLTHFEIRNNPATLRCSL